jgi:hypothetical protein
MKKVIHYPKFKDYYSSSSEFSKTDSFFHLEVRNFNLLNGLVFIIIAFSVLSLWNPLVLIIPLALVIFISIEFISLVVYCRDLDVERKIEAVRFCEGERLKIKYFFNLPLKFKTFLFEDFEGVSSEEQIFKVEKLKNSSFDKSYHLNQGFGEFNFKYLNVVISDAFELFSLKVEFQKKRKIHISPYVQTLPIPEYESLSDAKNIGEYEFIKRGISPIFYGLRDYRYGDPFKFINWKASTKANKVLINEFENIQSLEAVIYIDLNPKHHIGSGVNSSWEYCRDLALSIGESHSNKSHLLQIISTDFISENTQANVTVDDLKHYLHHHLKTVKSQARGAKESLSLVESAATISFILPLGFYTDLVDLFDELILKSEVYGQVDIFLVDAFDVVKDTLSPEFRPRVLAEQKNAIDLIKRVKDQLLVRGISIKICTVREPHNISQQMKTVK